MYIAPGQGLTTPWGGNFDVNRNILSLRLFVASFKIISLKSDFIQFFHDFTHVYSPKSEADSSQGAKFRCQQKCLVTSFICCKFKKMSLKSDFIHFFFMISYMYIASGQGHTAPGDKVLMSTETSCHFGHLLLVSNYRRQ